MNFGYFNGMKKSLKELKFSIIMLFSQISYLKKDIYIYTSIFEIEQVHKIIYEILGSLPVLMPQMSA